MALLPENVFKKIAEYTAAECISIFLPTQRGGKDVLEEKSKKQLKSIWQEVSSELESRDVPQTKIEKLGEPVQQLMEDRDFWRHQSDGLALFIADGFFEKYTLPINFDTHIYIGKEFYVKPLLPVFKNDDRFYLLAVQLEDVEFFEATKYSIGKIEVDDLAPGRLEERVGFDYKEKTLQFQSQNPAGESAIFHGQGASERNRKKEIKQYFRAIDQGLHSILNEETAPLVVACQDYLFTIYEDANTYQHLYDKPILENPADSSMLDLHQKALDLLEPELEKEKREKLKKMEETNPDQRSASIDEIVQAAHEGKIDTLFLENRAEVWGTFDEQNMKVEVQEEQNVQNYSLMNLAVAKVIENGGQAYLLEHAFMPQKETKMNALFRYN